MSILGLIIGGMAIKRIMSVSAEKQRRQEAEYQEKKEEERRRRFICHFCDGISWEDFRMLVLKVAKRFRKKLIYCDVQGTYVYCTVRSQSGISTWNFTVDFNDYGHLTGNYYWIACENLDSQLPDAFADAISAEIASGT